MSQQAMDAAVERFRVLLEQQAARARRMENSAPAVDFAALPTIKIGVCGGDGIGPILMEQAKRLLDLLLRDELASGKVQLCPIEGLTLENRLEKGQTVPEETMAQIKACHVLLKGPTTTPKGGSGRDLESANVALRRELDLFANVRPVAVPELGIDWTFFRENTEGEYVLGSSGVAVDDLLCCDFKVTTRPGTRRIAKAALDYARANGKKSVAIVTKANIMKKTDGSFSQICHEVAKDYPEIDVQDWYVDIMAANLVNPEIRTTFQVFVLPNLYGDIITDEAAQIQGGVGTAGSANIGAQYAMFEAIHGSAPRMIEQGLGDYANPSSLFMAVELMLRHIGFAEKADRLAKAMDICTHLEKRVVVTGGKDGATCAQFADYLLETIEKQ